MLGRVDPLAASRYRAQGAAGTSTFLIDEMFPPAAARLLRESYDHGAVHVFEIGLQAAEDSLVVATARAGRVWS